jgi:hypothetical protein
MEGKDLKSINTFMNFVCKTGIGNKFRFHKKILLKADTHILPLFWMEIFIFMGENKVVIQLYNLKNVTVIFYNMIFKKMNLA